MSEQNLWKRLKAGVGKYGHFCRVENMAQNGMPDINFFTCIEGWIEAKFRADLPARESTQVFGSKGLRAEQEYWIDTRAKMGANVWILAQAGDYLFLVSGKQAKMFNSFTLTQLIENSTWMHKGRMSQDHWMNLVEVLSSPNYLI